MSEEDIVFTPPEDKALARFRRGVPAKMTDWTRFIKTKRTINDMVEDAHRALMMDDSTTDEYQSFLNAVYDEEAVEGSLAADNFKAAEMLRAWAQKQDGNELGGKKLATIVKALNVVLRRYHESRKIRRLMVSGEIVPPENYNSQADSGD